MPRKKRTILTNIFPLGGKKFREVILKNWWEREGSLSRPT